MTKAVRATALGACLLLVGALVPLEAIAAPRPCGPEVRGAASSCRGSTRRPSRGRRPPPRRRPTPPPRPRVSAEYLRMRARWHGPPTAAERTRWLRASPPPLVLRPVGGARPFSLVPDRGGAFEESQLALAREAFTYREDGQSHDVHPRLIELCYRAVRQFRAPYVYLVSGYRTTRATSRHNQGRAMDIVLPGVSEERLAAFLRAQGFVGVGVYPTSGFTHVDVRARSYYWVDRSGPEQPSMLQPVRVSEVSRNDAAARRRGERPVADLVGGAAESDESGAPLTAVETSDDEVAEPPDPAVEAAAGGASP